MTSTYNIDALMERVMVLASNKGLKPGNCIILAPQKFYKAFKFYYKEYGQVQLGNGGKADIGIREVSYSGVPIYPDVDCPVGSSYASVYLIPTSGIEFQVGKTSGGAKKEGMFTVTPWVKQQPRQRVMISSLECRSILMFKNPAKCFEIRVHTDVGAES